MAFPSRLSPRDFPPACRRYAERVAEIRRSVEAGANEIDVVITRAHVFGGRWQALYDEVATFKQACGTAHMKVILGTGDLLTFRNVARASFVAMMAGADFIKTSTGKEPTNATLPVSLVMVRAIREYAQQTGMAVGFKPAGGIRTAKQSIDWLALMKEELGSFVDAGGTVPIRREWLAGRHRAATGALCNRTVLGRVSASDCVTDCGESRRYCEQSELKPNEHCRKIRQHGVRTRAGRSQGSGSLAGAPRSTLRIISLAERGSRPLPENISTPSIPRMAKS